MLHLRARWYSPYLNQFISPDTIIPDYFNPQSLNRYSYVYNNPINYIDPSGYQGGCLEEVVEFGFGPDSVVCIGGGGGAAGRGGGFRGGGISGKGIIGAGAAGVVVGGTAVVIRESYQFETADSPTPFRLPGFDLSSGSEFNQTTETIPPNVCYEPKFYPGSTPVGIDLPQVLPFPPLEAQQPLQIPGFSLDPIDIPIILPANNPFFEEVFYNGRPVSRQDRQPAMYPDLIEDLTFEYPEINPWEWKKVEQIFEYEGELHDLHWFEARGIVERGKREDP